jgi:hypothetical protein
MENFHYFLVISLIIYSLFVSYLYNSEIQNKDSYLKDKVDYVNNKQTELNVREQEIMGKEQCMRNLTKYKTINDAAVKILQSYQNDLAQS